MKRLFAVLLPALLILPVVSQLNAAETTTTEKLYYENRSDIPLKYRWDLSLIFPSRGAFEEAFKKEEAALPTIEQYKGRLGESSQVLAEALKTMFQLEENYGELMVYASQSRDLDTRDPQANDMYLRVNGLGARLDQALSFIDPEIDQIPDNTLAEWRKGDALKPYDHYLDNLVRLKPHVRSADVEQVLAAAGPLADSPFQAWSNLTSADIQWPTIKDEKGEETKVVPALYYSFVANQDRRIRKDAALALFGKYTDYANTFAATYNGQVQRDMFFAHSRNYDNALDMVLNNAGVPRSVVDNLVSTVHDNFDLLYQYASLRKDVLGVDEFHVYDLYVPLVPEAQKHYSFEDAKKLALEFWRSTYGEEYAQIAQKAFDNRWVDVYAGTGKRGGAYSWGTYNSVPYLFLNWGGTLEDVFTLVHEMGHSVHTYLSNKNQPYQYSEYSLFVAEVASVASEALFLQYMLDRTDDPTERLDLLNLYLNNITGTFLRQIFFHEFEYKAHQMAENGQALTKESLGKVYGDLWQQYYGPNLVLDDQFKAGWARISHYYRTYYVWVYATSFSAGEAIAQRFREGDKTAVDDYLAMLKLGGSVYPMDALKRAGVDMNDPSVIRTVMVHYKDTLNEMTKLLQERKAQQK